MDRSEDRANLEAALIGFVDVTDEFADRNREDRFLRSPGGDTVKVKILRDTGGARPVSAPGHFHVSGAIVGPDGKALKRADDTLAIWPPPGQPGMAFGWTHVGHSAERPEVGMDRVRRMCALRTLNQEAARAMIDGELEGFDTVEGYEARKAAEREAASAPPAADA